jgi:peptidoglycan-N-acetylglucosamine deacetylase
VATAWALVVIHDLPGGAMAQPDRFIAMVRTAGGRFRQDFPPECVPLRGGRDVRPMHDFVTATEEPTFHA